MRCIVNLNKWVFFLNSISNTAVNFRSVLEKIHAICDVKNNQNLLVMLVRQCKLLAL